MMLLLIGKHLILVLDVPMIRTEFGGDIDLDTCLSA